ncbi:MAG TPA: APC family permease [Thermoleophilia bacterium]|nr:APC family permease [Thermoleophilia bacterium]
MTEVSEGLRRVPMRVWVAVFVVFSFVCSGGFGIEDMVSGSGPGFALLLLLVIPFVWGLPQALVCSELGSALPEDGGLYRWSRRANGQFMGFQTGWWWTLSIFVDSAVYIALTVDYMQNWFHFDSWVRWGIAIVLIAVFAYVNVRGIQLASSVLVVFQVLVFIPFFLLAVIGLANWHHNPFSPMLLHGNSLLGGVGVALSVGIWMYSGFESLSTMAGEIQKPQKVIPKALMITLPIVISFYVLSTMGGLSAVGRFQEWGTSGALDFMGVGRVVGGQILRYLFFVAMFAGNFALFLAFLGAGARPSYTLSKDKLAPKFLSKTHPKYGTPYAAILLMAAVDVVLVRNGFATLIVIDVFLLMLAHITIYISAIRLRINEPDLERPYRVGLGTPAFIAMCAVPITVAVFAMSPWGNGWDYFIWGTVAALTGPPAYFVFKRIYGGQKALDAERAATVQVAGDAAPVAGSATAPAGSPVVAPVAD